MPEVGDVECFEGDEYWGYAGEGQWVSVFYTRGQNVDGALERAKVKFDRMLMQHRCAEVVAVEPF